VKKKKAKETLEWEDILVGIAIVVVIGKKTIIYNNVKENLLHLKIEYLESRLIEQKKNFIILIHPLNVVIKRTAREIRSTPKDIPEGEYAGNVSQVWKDGVLHFVYHREPPFPVLQKK